MAGYKIEITIKAKKDMREIHAYITNNLNEPSTANKLLDKIEEGILSLGHMPLRFAVEQDEQLRLRNLRKLIIGNYLIFYIVNEKKAKVIIVRVLYSRRDWVNLL